MKLASPAPRAVIVGMGACTPMGRSVSEMRDSALQRRSAIGPSRRFADTPFADTPLSVFDTDPEVGGTRQHQSWIDRGALFVLAALDEAMQQARWHPRDSDRSRVAVVVGTSHSGIESAEKVFGAATATPAMAVDPRWLLASSVDHPAGILCARLGLLGPKYSVSSACASSNTAIGMAADLIADGVADMVLVAGTDTVSVSILAGFGSLRAIGRQPTAPFSLPVGLTLGEGAGVMLIESLAHAQRRGCVALAEVVGYGLSGDAHHETAPDSEGRGVSAAITSALHASGLGAEQIDIVSAHGTGTDANDGAEVAGTYRVVPLNVPITSSKSFLGHTLGASGMLELILALACAERGYMPHTANFCGPRAGCRSDVDYLRDQPRAAEVDLVLKNNFGFGGNNSSLLVRRSLGADLRPARAQEGDAVFVTGIGAVCGAGRGWAEVCAALWKGQRRTAPAAGYDSDVGLVGALTLPPALKSWGRSSPMIKFGLVAAGDALDASGLVVGDHGDVGLICGVMNGAERSIEKYFESVFREGPEFASAMHFPMTTLNAMGGAISIANRLRGFNTTLSTGQAAVSYASAVLRRARQRALLVASGDELTPRLHEVFARLLPRECRSGAAALAGTAAALGEGAVALLLEPRVAANARGAALLAEVLAVVQVQDGRLAKIRRSGMGVERAIRQALVAGNATAADVCAVALSVPPLPHFQRAAQAGLQACCGPDLPAVAIDGVLGYCPSASFGLTFGVGVEVLQRGTLPDSTHARGGGRHGDLQGPVLVLGISLLGDITCALLGKAHA